MKVRISSPAGAGAGVEEVPHRGRGRNIMFVVLLQPINIQSIAHNTLRTLKSLVQRELGGKMASGPGLRYEAIVPECCTGRPSVVPCCDD